jgi:hypothetical protein
VEGHDAYSTVAKDGQVVTMQGWPTLMGMYVYVWPKVVKGCMAKMHLLFSHTQMFALTLLFHFIKSKLRCVGNRSSSTTLMVYRRHTPRWASPLASVLWRE